MIRDSVRLVACLFVLWARVVLAADDTGPAATITPLATAHEHRLRGRYEEASDAYQELLKSADLSEPDRIACVISSSRIHEETGRYDEAEETVTSALMSFPKSPALLARHGELCLLRGRYKQALELARSGIDIDSQHVHSRLILAHALAETGELDEAAKAYRWFVQYYNREQPKDAETLLWVGEGAAQYARWNRVSSIFRFVVNEVCPDALKDDKNRWQAPLLSGNLLLEKYNESQAVPEFHNALRINPHLAEIHAALGNSFLQDYKLDKAREFAGQALKLNGKSPAALVLMADTHLMSDVPGPAAEWIEKALAVNPSDQRVLGRKAALALLNERLLPKDRFAAAWTNWPQIPTESQLPADFTLSIKKSLESNTHPGELIAMLGNVLETHRRYDLAEICYRKAIEVMPQLSAPRTQLGMLCMRTGQVEEAEKILNEAFEADPFHVRVSNMRKVVGVLKGYDTITTPHFVIRIEAEQKLLGQSMADFLERIYPELTGKFGFEPAQRTQFEIYCNSKGTPAHAWFSSRMIGLPWIQTIGASTGVIVALASPNQTQRPYHWGRVLRHEFSHVLTLQATQFNIPHWYTEALAVRIEGSEFPPDWEELLLERQPKGELFNLDTINDGFRKPKGPDDWTLAYCQASLYAVYLEQTYGADANARLLTAFREGKTTEEALRELFSVAQSDFEEGYREFLAQRVATFTAGRAPHLPDLKTAEERSKAHPEDMQAADEYAFALMRSRRVPQARKLADTILEKEPTRPYANVIVAILSARAGQQEAALTSLQKIRDTGEPNREVLAALGSLAAQAKNWEVVLSTAQLGRKSFPRDELFVNLAAKACAEIGTDEEFTAILQEQVRLDQDDPAARRKLAQLRMKAGDADAARRWAADSLLIDVTSVETQELLGQACLKLEDWTSAEQAFRAALTLDADRTNSQLGLIEVLVRTKRRDEAVQQMEQILKAHPNDESARSLKQKLGL